MTRPPAPALSDATVATVARFDVAPVPDEVLAVTAVDLDALDAARAGATPGPWTTDGDGVVMARFIAGDLPPLRKPIAEAHRPDAALIVAMHAALPDLIADARKLRALRDAVMGLADRWDAIADGSTDPVARYVDRAAAGSLRTTVTAALASPAPAPRDPEWEDRYQRGFTCPTCRGIGRTIHNDLPDGTSRTQGCLVCDGTGVAPAPAPNAEEGR